MRLNDVANIAELYARLHDINRHIEALLRHFDETLRMCRGFFHHEHLAGIPMKAVFNDGDIDIDDIAFLENLGVAGYAVANDVIYRGADRFRKTVIIQGCGDGLLHVDDVVVTDFVQFSSADTRFYERADHLEDFGGEASGNAHFGDVFRRFDAYGHSVEVLLYILLSVLFAAPL